MGNFKVEKDFMIDDYKCVIVGTSMGHRCGYVGLLPNHKQYGLEYNAINVDVHGGLTYSREGNTYPVDDSDRWWIGFDCAHYRDGKDFALIKELNNENTSDSILKIERMYPMMGEQIRTTNYVEDQLISLVEQLKEV